MSLSEALLVLAVAQPMVQAGPPQQSTFVLQPSAFRHYIEEFNRNDAGRESTYIDNKAAWAWLEQNIPFFESSDKGLEEMYYFRWWTFRKHIQQTPEGFVITEFLPDVPGAGKLNTMSRSAAHHFYEGRWLRNHQYLKDYAYFWFRKGGEPRRYSFWAADAIRSWCLVTQDQEVAFDLYPELVANYQAWEKSNQDPNGLFWQTDERDGMESSIGGSGHRPTINSYMYGEALALGDIANWLYRSDESMNFGLKAARLRELVERRLWNEVTGFYQTLPRGQKQEEAGVRELAGYVPWYFNLPKPGHEVAWKYLLDPQGFYAPYGPTTAERRDPRFMVQNPHERLWNGPSWPFATSQTLTALANLLNNYKQNYISKKDYLDILRIYARSQHQKRADGTMVSFLDENVHPDTGEWLARGILAKFAPEQMKGKEDKDPGRDYNHSTFNDLIITGLVGLRPRMDHRVEVNPLVPEGAMDYFCLDGVRYHDWNLTILWDRTGQRYRKGKGLRVFADGQEVAAAPGLEWVMADLPQAAAGWKKYPGNPVIGGGRPTPDVVGTVFDIAVLNDGGKLRLYGSWRPKLAIALFEGTDGAHWSKPEIVLSANPASGWEDDVNRPYVLKRKDGYHMWYTGQSPVASRTGHSWIGYATSQDGKVWKRMSDKPVLSAELPWEKAAVMCPSVLWDEEAKLFRMWYSGGENWEPDAIGYATSPDGLHWTKHPSNPIFRPDKTIIWEQMRVTGSQVFRRGDWYYMFYIGFRDRMNHTSIGMARSRDGITNWERYPGNPIIRSGQDGFDEDACYKPFTVFDGKRWLLWYNGRHVSPEYIGLAIHEGEDLGF